MFQVGTCCSVNTLLQPVALHTITIQAGARKGLNIASEATKKFIVAEYTIRTIEMLSEICFRVHRELP